jgi:hypothetical protein
MPVGLAETGSRFAQTGSQLPRGPRPGVGFAGTGCVSQRPVRSCLEDLVQAARRRRADGQCAWAQAPFVGSGEPEPLFLVRPGCRQIADEPGDGQIGRGPTLGDRFNDALGGRWCGAGFGKPSSGSGSGSSSPRPERFVSEDAERAARCEMTLDVQCVVNNGVN